MPLAITLAIQALVALAMLAVPAMAPALAEALHVSPSLVGVYVALAYVGAILASTVGGPLVLRYGALRVSQWGLLACAAGMGVIAVSPSLLTAALGAFLTGLGYGPITPASSHLLARTTPPHRIALVFSVKQTGVPLGGVLAGVLVPAITLAGGVSAALWSVAASCVACALVAQLVRAGLDADRDPSHALGASRLVGPVRLVLGHPGLARLVAASLIFAATQMALASYLVTYLHTSLGYSLVAAGSAMSVALGGGVVGRVVWGYVTDRWVGAVRMLGMLAILMGVCSAATAALTASVPPVLVALLLAAFGASATGWNGVYLAEVTRRAPPGMAGAATGGALALTFCGVVLGPVLFGALAGLFDSYRAAYFALALPSLLLGWKLLRER